jgi:phosphohistidine phosphatase
MKLLYLLRHAKSSWDNPDIADFDRPLNKRGRKAAKLMAHYLLGHGITPQSVICSPARRTRDTLKHLLPALTDRPVQFDHRIYEASYQTLLLCLADLPNDQQSVMLIGHNPGLERLALYLMNDLGHGPGAARLQDKYPTGSLAILSVPSDDWGDLKVGSGRLDDFIRPADLDASEDPDPND